MTPPAGKWHIWRPAFAYAAQQWFVDCATSQVHDGVLGCRCAAFETWREAMDYANRQIREQQFKQAARARFIEVRPGATPSTTDVRVVFRCPACVSEGA